MDGKAFRGIAIVMLLAVTPLAGCATDPWTQLRGPGFGANSVGGDESLRPVSTGDKASGASRRARDIENHLGFE